MAVTEQKPANSTASKYVEFDEFIEYQLKKTHAGIQQTDLLSGGVLLAVFLTAYLLLFAIFDQWVIPGGFSDGWRWFLLAGVAAGSIAWTVIKIIQPAMRRVNSLYAARQIEKLHPELKSGLLSWVDFREKGKTPSAAILSALEKRTAHQIERSDIEQAVDRRLLMRSSYVLLGLVIALCLYTLFSPKRISPSLWRALIPTSSVQAATRTQIVEIKPGDTEVLARDQLDVTAELTGSLPEEVTLLFSTADRRFIDEPVVMRATDDPVPTYRARLTGEGGKGLLQDVTYHVVAGDARSKNYTIRVNQPPSATVTSITYEYPRYMGLQPSQQEGGTIDAWEGTFVTVRAETNMPVKRGVVYCSDHESTGETAEAYEMKPVDGRLEARWRLKFREDGTFARFYHVQVWNDREKSDPQPVVQRIKIRPDLPPEITLIHPTQDMEAPLRGKIPIAFNSRDPDFMLRRVSLKLEQNGEALTFPPPLFEGPPDTAEFGQPYRLDLGRLALNAGDALSLYLEAEDNFEPFELRRKNISRSPKITMRIVDPQSQQEEQKFDQKQDQQVQEKLAAADDQAGERRDDAEQQPKPEQPPRDPQQPGNDSPMENQPGDEPKDPMRAGEDEQPQQNQREGAQGEQSSGKGQGGQEQSGSQGRGTSSDQQQSEGKGTDPNGKKEGQPGGATDPDGTGDPKKGRQNSSGNSGSNPPRDRAADDEALRKLHEWNERQKQQEAQQNGEKQPQPSPSQDQQGQKGEGQRPSEGQDNKGQPGGESPGTESGEPSPTGEKTGQPSGEPDASKGGEGQEASSPSGKGDRDAQTPMNSGENQTGDNQPGDNQRGNPTGEKMPQQQNQPREGGNKEPQGQPGAEGQQPNQQPGAKPDQQQPQGSGNQPGQQAGEKKGSEKKPGDSQSGTGPGESTPNQTPSGERGENQSGSSGTPNSTGNPGEGRPDGEQSKDGTGNEGKPNQQPGQSGGEKSSSGDPSGQGRMEPGKEGSSSQPGGDPQRSNEPAGQGERKPGDPSREGERRAGDPNSTPTQPGDKPSNEPGNRSGSDSNPSQQPGGDQKGQPAGEQSRGKRGDQSPSSKGGESPGGEMSSGQQSSGKGQPGDQSASGSQSGSPTEGGSQPSGEQSGQPGNESQPSQSGGDQKPAGGQPSSGDGQPQQNGGEKSAEGKAGKGDPQQSGDQQSGSQQNGDAKQPGGEQNGGQKSGDQQGGGKKSGGEKSEGGEKGGGEQGGQQPGSQGGSESGGQQSGGQQGGNEPGGGESSGTSGSPSSAGNSGTGGKPMDRPHAQADGGSSNSGEGITPEKADLENKKQSTGLALKRLREQLERGESPQQLMDELGFTQKDLEGFMQRLEERLADPGIDQSTDSEAARRQFEALLRGIQSRSEGELRSGGDHERKASQSFGAGNRPVPPEYRKPQEAIKKRLSTDKPQK